MNVSDLPDPPAHILDMQKNPPRVLLAATSSEGLRIASQVTPHRLKELLIAKGPSPIRCITRQLAADLPGFDHFSVSKQRRLIMSALESLVPPVFEKIGWGSWAVIDDTRPRRESITNPHTLLHNIRPPDEIDLDDTGAIISDSDDEEDSMGDDDKRMAAPEIFHFDEDNKLLDTKPAAFLEGHGEEVKPDFANRVPLNLNTPSPDQLSVGGVARRRKLSSAALVAKPAIRHSLFNRSRLNLLENIESYILSSARSSWGSPPPALQRSLGTPVESPTGSYTEPSAHLMSRSKETKSKSYNESHMRSTLNHGHESDTDEEDWATLGPDSLAKSTRPAASDPTITPKPERTSRSLTPGAKQSWTLSRSQQESNTDNQASLPIDEEASAAQALVGLRST